MTKLKRTRVHNVYGLAMIEQRRRGREEREEREGRGRRKKQDE